jgi:hypothetical protein
MTAVDTFTEAGPAATVPPERAPQFQEPSRRGPNPFVVAGAAFVLGVALAKWIDWRCRGRTRG